MPPSHITEPVQIEDGVVVALGVTVMPGTTLARGCFISAGGTVAGHIPAAAVVKNGKVICGVNSLINPKHKLNHPWMNHFSDAYPEEMHGSILKLGKLIEADSQHVQRSLGRRSQ